MLIVIDYRFISYGILGFNLRLLRGSLYLYMKLFSKYKSENHIFLSNSENVSILLYDFLLDQSYIFILEIYLTSSL